MNFLVYLYFILPKINFIEFAGYGLRFQDIISLVMIARLSSRHEKLNKQILFILFYFPLHIMFGFELWGQAAILDFFRLLQYVLIGKFLAKTFKHDHRTIDYIIYSQIFLAILQFTLVIPNYDTGRGVIYSPKYSGSFGVSSEFTYSMLILSFIRFSVFKQRLITTSVCTLNGTTTALLAFIAIFSKVKKIPNYLIYFFAVLTSFLLPVSFLNIDILDLADKSTKTIWDIKDFANHDFIKGEFLSLIHRSTKAIGVIEVFLANPEYVIFGLGFGAIFTPVDFGFLRIFGNFGFFGLYLFYRIFRFLRTDFFLLLVISNLLFDGIWSSTVGPLIATLYFLYIKQANGDKVSKEELCNHGT